MRSIRKKTYPTYDIRFTGNELKYVTRAIRAGWISSSGSYVEEFEKKFAKYLGVKYAFSCTNGTSALHLALMGLGIGKGDDVIVPSLTFIATANAVRYSGARPVFADIDSVYWQIDPKDIERRITKKTKALMPVHFRGHPAKIDEIMRIARQHKLFVIEDTAQGLGAAIKGKKAGSWGDAAAFSFFGNKIMTTGEGGMVTTNSSTLARRIAILRNHGRRPEEKRYLHDIFGYNYLMTNLQAAVGLAQLEMLPKVIAKKRQIARWYWYYLSSIDGIVLPVEAPWAKKIYWLYSVLLDEEKTGKTRDELISLLQKEGIGARPFYVPVHKQPCYGAYHKVSLPHTEHIAAQGLNLPSSPLLLEADIREIARRIKRVLL